MCGRRFFRSNVSDRLIVMKIIDVEFRKQEWDLSILHYQKTCPNFLLRNYSFDELGKPIYSPINPKKFSDEKLLARYPKLSITSRDVMWFFTKKVKQVPLRSPPCYQLRPWGLRNGPLSIRSQKRILLGTQSLTRTHNGGYLDLKESYIIWPNGILNKLKDFYPTEAKFFYQPPRKDKWHGTIVKIWPT